MLRQFFAFLLSGFCCGTKQDVLNLAENLISKLVGVLIGIFVARVFAQFEGEVMRGKAQSIDDGFGTGQRYCACSDLAEDEAARYLSFFVRDRRSSFEVIDGRSKF